MSGNAYCLRLWTENRENLIEDQLGHVGSLELALIRVIDQCPANSALLEVILDAIVRQRLQLRQWITLHIPKHGKERCYEKEDRFLDVHAWCAIKRPLDQRVPVHCSLYPKSKTIYTSLGPTKDPSIFEKLHEVGFRDIGPLDSLCSSDGAAFAPVGILLSSTVVPGIAYIINTLKWFESKGQATEPVGLKWK